MEKQKKKKAKSVFILAKEMLKKKDMNLCGIGLVVYRLEEYLLTWY